MLAVGAYHRDGDTLRRTALARVDVQGERTPVDLPEADLYLVNDDDLTFATVRPDAERRGTLIADAGLLPTPLSRRSRSPPSGTCWSPATPPPRRHCAA